MIMELTSENVNEVFTDCLFKEDENTDNHIKAEGIQNTIGFHPGRIESHKEDVKTMLECLPDDFQAEKGGGMTFLNACNDKDGSLIVSLAPFLPSPTHQYYIPVVQIEILFNTF